MTDVSGVLRAARERAGFTIEQISERTKIKVVLLQAIERGEFEQLPGEFFTRAFLRTYARELHLSPDEIVGAYDARNGHPADAVLTPAVPAGPHLLVSPRLEPAHSPLVLPSPRRGWPTVALACAIALVVWSMNRPVSETRIEQPEAVGTAGVAGTAQPARATPPAPPRKLTIDIRPIRKMWVAGMADGQRVLYRLVEPGEVIKLEATTDVWVRLGDAGAFEYSLNGVPGKPLGASGDVREVQITRDTLAAFQR